MDPLWREDGVEGTPMLELSTVLLSVPHSTFWVFVTYSVCSYQDCNRHHLLCFIYAQVKM